MRMRKTICIVLAYVLMMEILFVSVSAAEYRDSDCGIFAMDCMDPRAIGSFNMKIPADSQTRANSSFSLMTGETVTIKASYAPFFASVDFGLVDSNGTFYYFNVTDGSIDKTILIENSGKYTLQIRNNSNEQVEVSGFVNY